MTKIYIYPPGKYLLMSAIRNRKVQMLILLIIIASMLGNRLLDISFKELGGSAILAIFIGAFMALFNKLLKVDV